MGIMLASTGLPLLRAGALPLLGLVTPGGGGAYELPDPVSSFTYDGVTVTLSVPLPVIYDATGEPVIISTEDSSITAMSPAGSHTDGNGAMIDPISTDSNGQGFEPHAGSSAQGPTKIAPYVGGLNKDPAVAGAIPIAAGSSFSVVKAIRAAGATSGTYKPIDRYVPISVMGSPPPGPGTWLRPPCVGTHDKTWRRVEDVNWGIFQRRTRPSGVVAPGAGLANILAWRVRCVPSWAAVTETTRRTRPAGEPAADGYATVLGREYSLIRLGLHGPENKLSPSTQADQDARTLALWFIKRGLDCIAAARGGEAYGAGAGHHFGYLPDAYMAAFAFRDQDMLDQCYRMRSSTVNLHFWVTANDVGYPVTGNWGTTSGGDELSGLSYQLEDVGVPVWSCDAWADVDGVAPPNFSMSSRKSMNASIMHSYEAATFDPRIREVMDIGMLQDGPGGQSGARALRGGSQEEGPTNIRAAALALVDKIRTWTPYVSQGAGGASATSNAIYDAWRQHVGQTVWTGRPDRCESPATVLFSQGGAAGEIDFDHAGIDYATETVTGRDVGYSLDGKHFVSVDIGTARTHTITGLRHGTAYQCRYRQRSASGNSSWSPNVPLFLNGDPGDAPYSTPRGVVTTQGTSSGAVANASPPRIVHNPYPGVAWPFYEVTPSTCPYETTELVAGLGNWTGGSGALSPTFQWKRKTAGGYNDIPGATAATYSRRPADSGTAVKCTITIGGVSVDTQEAEIPATQTFGPNVLIDTDFTGVWPLEWPALDAAVVTGAATYVHAPGYVSVDGGVGGIFAQKTAAGPSIAIPLTGAAAAGTYGYKVTVSIGERVPPGGSAGSIADHVFQLGTNSGVVKWAQHTFIGSGDTSEKDVATATFSGTFTIGAGAADKSVRALFRNTTRSGGIALGSPGILSLRVEKDWTP